MHLITYCSYFALLTYIYIGLYVLIKGPKELLNRVCFADMISFAVWSLGMMGAHNPSVTENTRTLFMNIGSFGWTTFSGFFLWMALIIDRKEKALRSKWLYLLLFGPPIFFIYKQWTGHLVVNFVTTPHWAVGLWSDSIWSSLFSLYYAGVMVAAFYFILDFGVTSKKATEKKQSLIIFTTVFFAFIVGSVTDVLLPRWEFFAIPPVGESVTVIWAFGLAYVVLRYEFLSINPAVAAANIISTMSDSLILLDPDGKIVSVNKETRGLLGYSERELAGKPGAMLFSEKERKAKQVDSVIKGENINNRVFFLRTKQGKDAPVSFSSTPLKDEGGELGGVVCLARDITELKKAEERFRALVQNSSDVIMIIDEKGRPKYISPSLGRVTGFSPEEVIGKDIFEYVHPDDRSLVRGVFEKTLGKPGESIAITADHRFKKADGSLIYIDSVECNRLDDPAIAGVVVNFRDITKRKETEKEIKSKVRELEKFQEITAGREERLKELKKEANKLCEELGKPLQY